MSKGLLGPLTIIPGTANNMTGTAVLTSKVMDWRLIRAGSVQVVWTGTPTGVFSLQGSLDYTVDPSGAVKNAGTWEDLGIALTAPAGAAGNDLADITITGIPWIRVIYTNASGTGTLTATGHGKGV